MGDFTLGCLLGQYDKAQSFDVDSASWGGTTEPGSWDITYTGDAILAPYTSVHSSSQGIQMACRDAGVDGGLLLRYQYARNDDALKRWSPDITTHDIRTDFWGEVWCPTSGDIVIRMGAQDLQEYYFPDDTGSGYNLQHGRLETFVHSGIASYPGFLIAIANENPTNWVYAYLDDVLTQIDPIILHPEYSMLDKGVINKADHRTMGGRRSTYKWGSHKAWDVPLRLLSDSHANLINWWWENQFNLVFTLDTSDSTTIHTCKISNDRQPIGKRHKPHNNLWDGLLRLESISDGALDF